MTTPLLADHLPSVAVFGPQSKIPTDKYLTELRSYIRGKAVLRPFIQAIRDLPKVWPTLLSFHPGFANLEDGPRYLQILSDWISGDGNMNAGAEVPSGILALPLLMIIHLAQYFQFLDLKGLKHHKMMDIFRRGAGVQGYCGGMWAAVSVACASDEEEIITNACQAIRAAVGVGASCDVVDDNPLKLSCIMVVRTKRAGQAEEICAAFPNTYISAITDARTVSIVGPPNILPDVEKFCIAQKLTVQMIPLRGKVHDPENRQLALDFSKFCAANDSLWIPDASRLLVPFRSNVDAQMMIDGSLCHERTYDSGREMRMGSQVKHSIAAFGIGDCISLKPFRDAGLQMTKLDMFSLIQFTTPSIPNPVTTTPESTYATPLEFSPDAKAVVGMACRFPGANSVEELWDVISSGRNMVQEVPKDRINFEECFRSSSDLRWASKQKFYGNFISDHDCFDNSFFCVSSKEATYMDPQQCLLLETAYQAMESSGYLCSSQSRDTGDRVGVFIGTSFIDHLEHTSAQTPNAYTATGTITAFLSGKISHHFGWTGPSEIIDTACSSSLVAISRACRSLQRKECTAALVGGVNFLSTTTQFLNLGRAGFLSSTGQCKPFDISADGYCRSEGCGLIVLKSLSEAIANNDQIFGVIPGIDPSLITYVEAHGTGTQVGDPVEIEGIRKAFARSKRDHTLDILKLIAEHAAIDASSIVEGASLDVVGVDSLSLIELKSALEETYDTELDLDLTVTVGILLLMLGQTSFAVSSPSISQGSIPKTSTSNFIQQPIFPKVEQSVGSSPAFLRDPIEALDHCQTAWTPTADHYGLTGYWGNVAPKQDELVVAYVVEAFEQFGVNWRGIRQGEIVPTFQCSPKHNKVVPQLWGILEDAKIVARRGTQFLRSSAALPSVHSSDLLKKLLVSCLTFANDSKLFSLTGSHLAKCLTGEEDAVPILFGSATNKTILNNFYQSSPLFKVSTDLLVILMDQVVPTGNNETPIRILEVGAGTGGTTAQLCEFLQSQNRAVEYTFTDISSTLVGAAKKKFSTQFPWMDFCTLNLEKDAPFNLQRKYDIVIETNVVHATSNIVNSCTIIRSLLRNNGFVVLLEFTRMQKYFDLVFGLLSGWWSAKDGRAYPLQPAEVWSGYLRQAGFKSFGCTTGPAEESRIQQLLVGSLNEDGVSGNRYDKAIESKFKNYEIEMVPYKVVDDLRIEADIYYPMAQYRSSEPMPIALMLHGGGYMTLSRRAIRPHQTQNLLNNNILPISLDYRLCPEVDALSGPITDIRDALIWARGTLPLLAKQKGVVVDVEKLVMVGWSTGGHLAMTTAWTSVNAGIKPRCAILSFYAPTDFEDDHWTDQDIGEYAPRSMSMEKIQKALSQKVISNYDGPKGLTGSEKNLGFLQPGDPRSELVLSLFQDGNGLSLLLNGLPYIPSNPYNTNYSNPTPPTLSQIQSFSPLSQVHLGVYKTPTFITHGTKDEVVPFTQAEAFIAELKERGIKCGGVFVQGKRHIFDAALRPGMEGWDKWIAPGYEFLMSCL